MAEYIKKKYGLGEFTNRKWYNKIWNKIKTRTQ